MLCYNNVCLQLADSKISRAGTAVVSPKVICVSMNIQLSLANCSSMLCYKNVCLHFTDKFIYYRGTGDIIPKLICAPGHASIVIVNSWITRHPVCIVQGCPVTPYPGFLFTQQYIIYTHSSENPFRCQKKGKLFWSASYFPYSFPIHIFSGFAATERKKNWWSG